MNNIREHIYLSALLHNIGQFYERAKPDISICDDVKKLYPSITPKSPDYSIVKYALWTAQFYYDHKALFFKITQTSTFQELADLLILPSTRYYFKESNTLSFSDVITHADTYALGARYYDLCKSSSINNSKSSQLLSIMQTIGLSTDDIKNKDREKPKYVPVQELDIKGCMPTEEQAEPQYNKLWDSFIKEFEEIKAESTKVFAETLYHLLFRYTTSVPALNTERCDISLFDYLKITAALAVSLYDHQQADGATDSSEYILIGADLSGIQSYIYEIISKYANKNLKGRSFYLRLLSDAIVRLLLKELNLFQSNIIYNSGGGFYLLAPDTKEIRTKFHQVVVKVEERLFEAHGTKLYIAIDYVELSSESLLKKKGTIRDNWRALFDKRDKKKKTKFATEIKDHYDVFFEPSKRGDEKVDKITGEVIEKEDCETCKDVGDVRRLTNQQIELGKQLKQTKYIVIADSEIKDLGFVIQPAKLGFYYHLVKESSSLKKSLAVSTNDTVLAVNEDSDNLFTQSSIKAIKGIEFYGGNDYPEIDFEKLVNPENHDDGKLEDKNDSFKRLGVLRMDVDNLGHVFQDGITEERSSLARYSALSRSFDYFFSGYLNTIWSKEDTKKSSIIVYSGGDDVFIVAEWRTAIKLAQCIHDDFKIYSCGNSEFSISGGISLVKPKFPIIKAADYSGEEESNAKNHKVSSCEKNSISFMNFAMNWEKEFPVVQKLKDKLVELIQAKELPSSFLSKLMMHHATAKFVAHKVTNIKTYWMVMYDLSRFESRHNKDEVKELIKNCKNEICSSNEKLNNISIDTNYHSLELWAFAARWAELEKRNIDGEKNYNK